MKKLYEIKRTGGCWCGCSVDYCQGVNLEYEDSPLYSTENLAKEALKIIAKEEKFKVYDDGLSAERYCTGCAMSNDPFEPESIEAVKKDDKINVRMYPIYEFLEVHERKLIEA